MKYIFIYLAILFLTSNSANAGDAKSRLSGIITDAKTKQPLSNASILIHDIKIGVISKKDGSYTTTMFTSGKYLVEVSYQGYATILENIEINGNTIKNFQLTETIVEQEAVTITGTTSATKIKNIPQSVTIVSKTDLFRTNTTNIIDALAKMRDPSAISRQREINLDKVFNG